MTGQETTIRLLEGFDDPSLNADAWNKLLHASSTSSVFQTFEYQKTWWEVFGRGKLLLIILEKEGAMRTIAPLFADQGMIYLIGSGGSDYLDLIGETPGGKDMAELLLFAAGHVQGFLGFLFYHIPDRSATISRLDEAGSLRNWTCTDEGRQAAPALEMQLHPEIALKAPNRNSLLRHERWFEKNGGLRIEHSEMKESILPFLDDFFRQHTERWAATPFPGLFTSDTQKLFYRRLTEALSGTGRLLFTRIGWKDRAIAYHYGFYFGKSFLWYKPSFEITLSRHSPGEVLLRQLLLLALEKNAANFDFGLGDEPFKMRFATNTHFVKNRGVYPPSNH